MNTCNRDAWWIWAVCRCESSFHVTSHVGRTVVGKLTRGLWSQCVWNLVLHFVASLLLSPDWCPQVHARHCDQKSSYAVYQRRANEPEDIVLVYLLVHSKQVARTLHRTILKWKAFWAVLFWREHFLTMQVLREASRCVFHLSHEGWPHRMKHKRELHFAFLSYSHEIALNKDGYSL